MKELSRAITMAAGLLLASGAAASDFAETSYSASGAEISLKVEGTYYSGVFDGGAAEIAAYDPRTKRLFVTNADANTVDVLSIRNIKNPRLLDTIDLSPYGAGVNSVAFKRGVVAIAVEADPKQDPGSIVFFNRRGKFLSQVAAGARA
jgi:2',3'-cyclic-nucleotide 2'-phosphodiesterase/3'-nucleotidase/5'-nucleotidase